jgi:SAM-dependent methyltransferase
MAQAYAVAPRLQNFVNDRPRLKRLLKGLMQAGASDEQWSRVIMNRRTQEMIGALNPQSLNVLEVSGDAWATRMKFKSYKTVEYPDYDISESTLDTTFDLIIAEQVFEHLLWPYRSAKNVYAMLNPGGHFLITTPFLVRIHNHPTDCSRWTETGMKYFLAECGFSLDRIQTGSWGNRSCVRANFSRWWEYRRLFHSLRNEPAFPISVWALAQK